MPKAELTRVRRVLRLALSAERVNEVGLDTGQSKRLRTVTPHRLFLAIVAALAGSKVESLADLLREFNAQNGTTTAYKAFYNRLARPEFAEFMMQMLSRLLVCLSVRTLEPDARSALKTFDDIVIQDGTSFAVKKTLSQVFPSRFTATDPAAVELHATYSGFSDDITSVVLRPDRDGERRFLPEAAELRGKLFVADRGYPSVAYFEALNDAGASFVIRIPSTYRPFVVAHFHRGMRYTLPKPVALKRFLALHGKRALDLDVQFSREHKCTTVYRLVVLPGKERAMTRLCTNLDRRRFPLKVVAALYRFRWQVELCFKEWKSYANLHRFNTSNEHIVRGLIWAALCAACLKRFLAHATQIIVGVPMSTRRVAMCARYALQPLFAALLSAPRRMPFALCDALRFLGANARRSNPARDRTDGRLAPGIVHVGV